MRRRDFFKVIAGSAAGWPLALGAQQPEKMHRIGFLTLLSGPTQSTEGFQSGLSQLGYVEGQNLIILYRWAAGRKDRLVDSAKELLQLKVELFASQSTEAIMAIRSINETIPIVMTSVSDPIGNKLVASFARPGGNTTGVTISSTDLASKRLGLLKEVVPNLSRVAVLVEREHPPTATMIKETQAAAGAMQIELQILEVHSEQIRDAFKSMERERPDALIVQQTASFDAYTKEIADLALDSRLPSVHENRQYVRAGGLMAYGPDLFALGQRAAYYVGRILKGTNAADLPVEQPTKFVLALNLKCAKTLDLTVPPALLATADEVIE
jgi:putative tryptophan/tyrosine transport system substrate-binding protein